MGVESSCVVECDSSPPFYASLDNSSPLTSLDTQSPPLTSLDNSSPLTSLDNSSPLTSPDTPTPYDSASVQFTPVWKTVSTDASGRRRAATNDHHHNTDAPSRLGVTR